MTFLTIFLLACGGEEDSATESAPTPGEAPAAEAAPPPAAPAAAPVTVASCDTPFGYCQEWAGTQWQALGADDAAREANARGRCRTTFQLGQACGREGLVGTCALEHEVTIYTGSVGASESSCRTQRGLWQAAN
jgi:hypothetical protein